MLNFAFIILACAAALGTFLALVFLRGELAAPPIVVAVHSRAKIFGLVHGGLGATGLIILLTALRAGAIHPAAGFAGFGQAAAWLFGIALLVGLAILALSHGRRGRASLLIAVHATLAISGIVVLMALVLSG